MRPQRLVVEGFGALRDRVDIDFTDVDFFALVGPTGAGKSTVIDAISFALYGAIPRYGENVAKPALSANANECKVQFDFACGDDAYRVTRHLRRDRPTKVQLDRLDAEGDVVDTLTTAVAELKQRVADIVGLPFSQFTTCVVLPQGRFDLFLHATRAERINLLVALLDLGIYERVAQAANQRAGELESEATSIASTLSRLAVPTDDELRAADERVEALATLARAIADLTEQDRELADAIATHEHSARRAALAVAALEAAAVPDDFTELTLRRADAAAFAVEATALEVAAEAARSARAAELAALPPEAEISAALRVHDEIERLGDEVATSQAAVAASADAATRSESELAAATAEARARRDELDALGRAHHAHALAAHLTAGEPCPVCEQTVATVPNRRAPDALTEAERALARAEKQRDAAEAAHRKAARAEATERGKLAELVAARERALATAAEIAARDELLALIATIHAGRTALTEAEATHSTARTAADRARSAASAIDGELTAHRTRFRAQRDAIVRAEVLELPEESGDLAIDWKELAQWASSARTAAADAAAAAVAQADRDRRRRAELIEPLLDRLREAGVDTGPRSNGDLDSSQVDVLADAHNAATIAHTRAATMRDTGAAARAQHTDLSARVETIDHEVAVAKTLGRLLSKTNFHSWLLRRVMDDLAVRASTHLLQLSSGRYTLALDDGDAFCVVDHVNAGAVRSAQSLSGGETFQAALALALALADQVTEFSPRGASALESIFLDEGFGSLDPEALDVVAGTIEQLGAGDRMVGIVTHVAALAERVPVRFRLTNDGRTSTITRESS